MPDEKALTIAADCFGQDGGDRPISLGGSMHKFTFLCAAALVAALPAAAHAEDQDSSLSLWLTGGSLGVGPEVAYRVSPMIGVRGGATFLGVNHDVDVNDITYRGSLKLRSYGANVDFYPLKGGLRVSAGFRIDRNKVDLASTPTSPVGVGSATFTPAQIGTLSGTVRAADAAPTLTVGYAGGLTKGLKFAVDGGVMFHGSPRIDDLKATGTLANDPTFRAQLADEERQIERRLHKYNVYPVVQLSVGYAF